MFDYPSYRAPHADQSRLCVPELDQAGTLLEENHRRFEDVQCCWMDVPLATIRSWAREETLVQAREYTQRYLPALLQGTTQDSLSFVNQPCLNAPLILIGHQPELYHSGVWFKNYLLASLAEKHAGIGVNILVDHDLARTFAMNVPSIGPDGLLHKETLSVDDNRKAWPWEHTIANDIPSWNRFFHSVVDRLLSVGIADPLLCELWPMIVSDLEQGKPLGEAFSAARHAIERSNGLQTFELPFSRLATGRSFACFIGEILSRIESVHESYNTARDDYRRHHRIKNHLQPIPLLARDGDWFESPFWVYSDNDPTRRGLWVVRDGRRLTLSDRRRWQVEWPGNGNFDEWFIEWRKLNAAKVSIRPRALTTTLFLRLAVSDLFIHGIGGGKYDQMTDEIVQSLWGIFAPRYVVATATLLLPIATSSRATPRSSGDSVADVLQQIRDWQFSPERLLVGVNLDDELDSLLRRKASLLAQRPSGPEKSAWHRELQRLNTSIRQRSPKSEVSSAELLREARNREQESAIAASREFSIALFPAKSVVGCLKKLSNLDQNPGFRRKKS